MARQISGTPPRDKLPYLFWGLFAVGILFGLVWMWLWLNPAAQRVVSVTVRNMPAYHVIAAGDIVTKSLDLQNVTTNTLQDSQSPLGYYTRHALDINTPIRASDIATISNPGLISGTLATAISADSAMILGGNLRAGDVVSLAVIPISETARSPEVVLSGVLVLDVITQEKETVIILAVPETHWITYLTKIRNASVMLARQNK